MNFRHLLGCDTIVNVCNSNVRLSSMNFFREKSIVMQISIIMLNLSIVFGANFMERQKSLRGDCLRGVSPAASVEESQILLKH